MISGAACSTLQPHPAKRLPLFGVATFCGSEQESEHLLWCAKIISAQPVTPSVPESMCSS